MPKSPLVRTIIIFLIMAALLTFFAGAILAINRNPVIQVAGFFFFLVLSFFGLNTLFTLARLKI